MIAAEDTALLLLAAGRSSRFVGQNSKLDAMLDGRPLGLHVVETLAPIPFRARLAIVKRSGIDYTEHGYVAVENEDPVGDMASSLRLGVRQAAAARPLALMIVLADMPRVSADHIQRLLAVASGSDAIVASTDGQTPRPPAIFGRAIFPKLEALTGDAGARGVIMRGHHVRATADELIDVDTREQLQSLH